MWTKEREVKNGIGEEGRNKDGWGQNEFTRQKKTQMKKKEMAKGRGTGCHVVSVAQR